MHLQRYLHQPYLEKLVLADENYTVIDVFTMSSNFTNQQGKRIRSIFVIGAIKKMWDVNLSVP
jgi:hypothetical protein